MKIYKKQFDQWNEKKKEMDGRAHFKQLFVHEREVWWCSVGVNVGVEIDGKNDDFERPVLILKTFNSFMFWGIPLTSKTKPYPTVFAVQYRNGSSFANIAQMRLFSSKRALRKLGMISEDSFSRIKCELLKILTINRPPPNGKGLGGRSQE